MSKQLAFLHDGALEGDSAFYIQPEPDPIFGIFEYHGQTLDQMKTEMLEAFVEEFGEDDPESIETVNSVKGAWIVGEKELNIIKTIIDAADPGNDSDVYLTNRILKAYVSAYANILGENISE